MASSTAEKRQLLNKMNSTGLKAQLGTEVSNVVRCVKGIWDFSKVGGATGDYNLVDDQGNVVKVPSGAIVLNSWVYAKAAATSGGSATFDFQLEGANDLMAAEAVASLTLGVLVQGIPDWATIGDAVKLTADRTLVMSINTAAATAGKLYCYVQYVLTL